MKTSVGVLSLSVPLASVRRDQPLASSGCSGPCAGPPWHHLQAEEEAGVEMVQGGHQRTLQGRPGSLLFLGESVTEDERATVETRTAGLSPRQPSRSRATCESPRLSDSVSSSVKWSWPGSRGQRGRLEQSDGS